MLNRMLFAALLLGFSVIGLANQQTFDRFTYWSLLTSSHIEAIHLAARAMGREQISDNQILDVAATVLWQQRRYHHDASYVDAFSWLAKDLSFSGNRRYQVFLQRCQNEFAQNSKLKKNIDEALNRIRDAPDADSFDVERGDLTAIRSQLSAMRFSSSELIAAYADKTIDLKEGESALRHVYQKYGYPTLADVSFRGEAVPGIAHWDVSYLRLWFPNVGGFRFSLNDEEEGISWVLMDQWPLEQRVSLKYEGANPDLAYALWTTDAKLLRETMKRLYQQKVSNTQTLDVIADRLWLSLLYPEPELIDALIWACKILEQSKNGRYSEVLSDISKKSQDKKLVSYASDALENLDSNRSNVYVRRDNLNAP